MLPARRIVPLSTLGPGRRRGRIARIEGGPWVQRLLDLGMVPETWVEFVRRAPLGDPLAYRIRGTCVALRRREASAVFVEVPEE
ncbi:MAG: ferrous iron transport protein A [Firmicutes bacterium]|nr:ferrous iron transport protein A [Bacillota bacterium]